MSRRLTVIAGSGALVDHVVAAARRAGDEVQIVGVVPQPPRAVPVLAAGLDPTRIIAAIRTFSSTHVVLAGGVSLSDRDRQQLHGFLTDGRESSSAGDAALSAAAHAIQRHSGAIMLGAHELAADLLAAPGHIAGPPLDPAYGETCALAIVAARAIGRLDLGQAVVVADRRVVAAEDLGGTDELLRRVRRYREQGLVGDGAGAVVLAKAAKPQQPLHVDMPAIGPATILGAAAAGIGIIVVEAGRVLLLERTELEALATEHGISIVALFADG